MQCITQGLPLRIPASILKCLLILGFFYCLPTAYAQQTLLLNTALGEPLTNEEHSGLLDEIVREALKRVGYTLSVEKLPAERGLRNANNGIIDGDIGRIKGIDNIYRNLIRVPEKVINMSFVAFSKEKINMNSGWESLDNRNVAYITGWKIYEKNTPDTANVTRAKNAQQLFYLLEKDRTDLILYSRMGGDFIINKFDLRNIKSQSPALENRGIFIYLHKKYYELVPKLSQALATMKKDGSYQSLKEKYLPSENRWIR